MAAQNALFRHWSNANLSRWVADDDGVGGDIFRNDRAGADDSSRSDGNTGQNKSARANESFCADRNRGRLKGKCGEGKIVGARADVGLLGNRGALLNNDFSECISGRTIA